MSELKQRKQNVPKEVSLASALQQYADTEGHFSLVRYGYVVVMFFTIIYSLDGGPSGISA
jgi:hypothetical protein